MAKKIFSFRGYEIEDIKTMSLEDFTDLLPSRPRRSIRRGFTPRQKKLIEKVKKANSGKNVKLRTHCRDIVIIPEMVGLYLEIYNGKEFKKVLIAPEMLGHFLGEFAPSRGKVSHGSPGMGATRSSLYVPLK